MLVARKIAHEDYAVNLLKRLVPIVAQIHLYAHEQAVYKAVTRTSIFQTAVILATFTLLADCAVGTTEGVCRAYHTIVVCGMYNWNAMLF